MGLGPKLLAALFVLFLSTSAIANGASATPTNNENQLANATKSFILDAAVDAKSTKDAKDATLKKGISSATGSINQEVLLKVISDNLALAEREILKEQINSLLKDSKKCDLALANLLQALYDFVEFQGARRPSPALLDAVNAYAVITGYTHIHAKKFNTREFSNYVYYKLSQSKVLRLGMPTNVEYKISDEDIQKIIDRDVAAIEQLVKIVKQIIEEKKDLIQSLASIDKALKDLEFPSDNSRFNYMDKVLKPYLVYTVYADLMSSNLNNFPFQDFLDASKELVIQSLEYKCSEDDSLFYCKPLPYNVSKAVVNSLEFDEENKKLVYNREATMKYLTQNKDILELGNNLFVHLAIGMGYIQPLESKEILEIINEQIGLGLHVLGRNGYFTGNNWIARNFSFNVGGYASGLLYRTIVDTKESENVMIGPFVSIEYRDLIQLNGSYYFAAGRDEDASGWACGVYVPLADYFAKLGSLSE